MCGFLHESVKVFPTQKHCKKLQKYVQVYDKVTC